MGLYEQGDISSKDGIRDFRYGRAISIGSITGLVDGGYLAPTVANAQRSIKSSSANDTAAGTGARTIRITYLDATCAGPFTETMTMNGLTAVNTVNTNICFIEKMEVLTAGSGTAAAGSIGLFSAANGGGSQYAFINIGEVTTYWAHHYVPTGKICYLSSIASSCTKAGLVQLWMGDPTANTGIFNPQKYEEIRVIAGGYVQELFNFPRLVTGPKYLKLVATPDATASSYYGTLDFIDA